MQIDIKDTQMTLYKLTINDQRFEVEVGAIQGDIAQVSVNKAAYQVKIEKDGCTQPAAVSISSAAARPAADVVSVSTPSPRPAGPATTGAGVVAAPMPGKILLIDVRIGDKVQSGQTVAIMEAMKMENNILTPIDGVVKEIRAAAGTDVATGDVILVIG
jgi:biotin carboxyl carrier protein